MELVLILVTVLCLTGILFGRFLPLGRWPGLVAGAVLLYLVGLIAWWYAMYFQIVSIDRFLAPFTYPVRDTLDGFVYLVPPALPPTAFLLFHARRVRPVRK